MLVSHCAQRLLMSCGCPQDNTSGWRSCLDKSLCGRPCDGPLGATQVSVPASQDRGGGARAGLPPQQLNGRAWRCLHLRAYAGGAARWLKPDPWPSQGEWFVLCHRQCHHPWLVTFVCDWFVLCSLRLLRLHQLRGATRGVMVSTSAFLGRHQR